MIQIKRFLATIFLIYTLEIFFLPLIHYLDRTAEMGCLDCSTHAQINSSCSGQPGPCNKPTHHHHARHLHDPAQCVICKGLFQDIEHGQVYFLTFHDLFDIVSCKDLRFSNMPPCGMLLLRSPPLTNFLI